MSKISSPISLQEYDNNPFIFRRWMISNLEGRLLTLVEAFGFENKREEAVKSLIRRELWDWVKDNLIEIPEDLQTEFESIVNSVFTNREIKR